jgi:hypothetical protein
MRKALRDNGLAIFFAVLFLASLAGQAVAGHAEYNQEQEDHAALLDQEPETVSLGRYVSSSHFANAVAENWQSEYLQFALFILATIWLVQRGSTESKRLEKAGLESDEDQHLGEHTKPGSPKWAKAGDWRTTLFSNSLLLVMTAIFFASWFAQSVTGWNVYNDDQVDHMGEKVSWLDYVGSADFWEGTLQNWQSEFLAVGSIVIFSVYLRQRGSAQSKPVGAPHEETATEG